MKMFLSPRMMTIILIVVVFFILIKLLKSKSQTVENHETTDDYKGREFSDIYGNKVTFTDEYIQCFTKDGKELLFHYWEILKIKCGVLGLDIKGNGKNFSMPVTGEDNEKIKKLVSFAEIQMKNIPPKEYRIKCRVCGHIYCYTNEDLKRNVRNQSLATMHSVSSAINAIGGTAYNMHEEQKHANTASAKIVDYSKCPKCNSSDIVELTDEEWQNINNKSESTTNSVSTADELKKFKDLLDNGVITQEEFDAKKKELLGL